MCKCVCGVSVYKHLTLRFLITPGTENELKKQEKIIKKQGCQCFGAAAAAGAGRGVRREEGGPDVIRSY